MNRDELDLIALAAIVMGKWADAGLIDGDDTSRQGDDDPEWRKAKLAVAAVRQFDGSVSGTP